MFAKVSYSYSSFSTLFTKAFSTTEGKLLFQKLFPTSYQGFLLIFIILFTGADHEATLVPHPFCFQPFWNTSTSQPTKFLDYKLNCSNQMRQAFFLVLSLLKLSNKSNASYMLILFMPS